MKNFRSSKNLKIIDTNPKDQSQLRLKIRTLEEQIEMLQKSNLNIFIPLSQHETKPNTNFQAIINKLKTQILSLQQEIQRFKTTIKKLEGEKEMQRITFQNELERLKEEKQQLRLEMEELREQNDNLCNQLENEQQKRKQKQKQAIQLRVENKFVKQDLQAEKKRRETVEKKYEEIMSFVLAVNFNSRIYKSREIKITAIQTQQLKNLKTYTEELEKKIKQLLSSKQEKIYLGVRKDNLGQEIVRLKQNIDLQLGLDLNTETTKSFLTAYNQTNNKFNELITSCKLKE